jgi:hypothetical protein
MIEYMRPEYQELQSEFKPVSAHSMCVQLLLRPLSRDEKRFETLLGCFNSKESKRQAVTIILIRTGPAKYRRLVRGRSLKPGKFRRRTTQDLQVADFDENFHTSTAWSIRDVFINNPRPSLNNPRPSLPFRPTGFVINGSYLETSLNCTTALQAGLEVGGFWGVEEVDIKVEHLSGEKIYTAVVHDSSSILRRASAAFAFTVRNVNSGEICGLIISFRFSEWFAVSIVHDLNEKDFKQGAFFDRTLNREWPPDVQSSRRDALVGCKLRDGSRLFFSLEVQGRETAHLKVGIMQ